MLKTCPMCGKICIYLSVRYFTNSNLETLKELQIENVGNDLKAHMITIQIGRMKGKKPLMVYIAIVAILLHFLDEVCRTGIISQCVKFLNV